MFELAWLEEVTIVECNALSKCHRADLGSLDVLTGVVTNFHTAAGAALTKAKNSKIHAVKGSQRNLFDDGGRYDGDKKEAEGYKQQHCQRSRRPQHRDSFRVADPNKREMPASSRRGDEGGKGIAVVKLR
jgi:hypothetical protein